MDVLKVSAQSSSIATAGALANTIRQHGHAEIQGIGPKAINQAVKAIAISRSYLASSGADIIAVPGFVDVEIEGQQRTAIRFFVKPRHTLSQIGSKILSHSDAAASIDSSLEDDLLDESPEEESPPPARGSRFIQDFPEAPLEKDEFAP
ncbi:stage V sporulation protein S [Candidatus Acetothermia bacterium]|nr:stage V sporulation protein S [Candidatus Acetothermia bacterium]MBI3643550.1 stage V sporulation protein S [Candidatus Acetothermia bacterium]